MFENKYPYTDFHEMNLDYILDKITEFQNTVDTFEATVLAEAKEYTDEQIEAKLADVQTQFDDLKAEVESLVSGLDTKYDAFVTTVNARMVITENKFNKLKEYCETILAEANAYTNYAILQNNSYIIDQTTKALSTVTVLNYFTGARTSIQDMFDYLAQFHLTNAATYADIAAANKTYNEMAAYNEDYTEWVLNGRTIINS